MRILMVISGLRIGGAETQVCDLSDKLHELGHDLRIITLLSGAEIVPISREIKIIELNFDKYGLFSGLSKFRTSIKTFKPDVVHAHLFHAIVLSRIIRLFVSIPKLIGTHHGMKETSFFRRALFAVTDFLEDMTTAVSIKASKAYKNVSPIASNGVRVIHNAIELTKFRFSEEKRVVLRAKLGISNESKVILAIGRLVWEKDYINLIESFVLASARIPDLLLVIIGDGPERKSLVRYVNQLDITDRVQFLGKQSPSYPWFSIADLFVSSSVREGFGLVLVEAMASGRPIVATNCGIADEFDKNLVDFVEPSSPGLLSKAIVTSIQKDKETKRANALKSLEFVRNKFSMDKIVLKWHELYES